MKFILLVIFLNAANPNDESILAHKAFATMEQCEEKAAEIRLATQSPAVVAKTFCVSEKDLLNLKEA